MSEAGRMAEVAIHAKGARLLAVTFRKTIQGPPVSMYLSESRAILPLWSHMLRSAGKLSKRGAFCTALLRCCHCRLKGAATAHRSHWGQPPLLHGCGSWLLP